MAYGIMTVDTIEHIASGLRRQHVVHVIQMAMDAGVLHHATIAFFDLDGFVKMAGREGPGVQQPVVGFGKPFAQKIMWQVAVIAGCHMAMTRVLPGVVMVLHHVAIRARGWVVAQIRSPSTKMESESPHSGKTSNCDRSEQRKPSPADGKSMRMGQVVSLSHTSQNS